MIEDFFPFWDIHPFIIPSKNTQSSFRWRASEISPFLEFHSKPLPNRSPVLEEQSGKMDPGDGFFRWSIPGGSAWDEEYKIRLRIHMIKIQGKVHPLKKTHKKTDRKGRGGQPLRSA